jgi:integration host factor subunit beta
VLFRSIAALANRQPHLLKHDVELAVNCMLDQITKALTEGQRIEIRGFGSFNLHSRPPRTGRNPKTGTTVALPEKVAIHFKPGKEMRDRVNASREHCKIEVDSTPTDNQQNVAKYR